MVNLGYNNGYLYVENNTLLPYPEVDIVGGKASYVSQEWEVLYKFFDTHNIEPQWLNCHFSWGYYDEEDGRWTGCMGTVIFFYMTNC